MILDDDNAPKKKPGQKRPLDPLSVEDLKEYIRELQEEIKRAEAEMDRKQKHKSAADIFFKKKE